MPPRFVFLQEATHLAEVLLMCFQSVLLPNFLLQQLRRQQSFRGPSEGKRSCGMRGWLKRHGRREHRLIAGWDWSVEAVHNGFDAHYEWPAEV